MKIEILGSGGAVITPRPGCGCDNCREAQHKGVPYSRFGPSVYIHDYSILVDTPEEIGQCLVRSQIDRIKTCYFTHWHPDHTMGRRVFEMNMNWAKFAPKQTTDVHLFPELIETFSEFGILRDLKFLAGMNAVNLIEHDCLEPVKHDDLNVTPLLLPDQTSLAFLFEDTANRVLIALDEVKGWEPNLGGDIDLAILPLGVTAVHPLTGNRVLPEDHPLLRTELSFDEALDLASCIGAKRTVFIHISEPDQISYEEFQVISKQLSKERGQSIEFGFDTQVLDL